MIDDSLQFAYLAGLSLNASTATSAFMAGNLGIAGGAYAWMFLCLLVLISMGKGDD